MILFKDIKVGNMYNDHNRTKYNLYVPKFEE